MKCIYVIAIFILVSCMAATHNSTKQYEISAPSKNNTEIGKIFTNTTENIFIQNITKKETEEHLNNKLNSLNKLKDAFDKLIENYTNNTNSTNATGKSRRVFLETRGFFSDAFDRVKNWFGIVQKNETSNSNNIVTKNATAFNNTINVTIDKTKKKKKKNYLIQKVNNATVNATNNSTNTSKLKKFRRVFVKNATANATYNSSNSSLLNKSRRVFVQNATVNATNSSVINKTRRVFLERNNTQNSTNSSLLNKTVNTTRRVFIKNNTQNVTNNSSNLNKIKIISEGIFGNALNKVKNWFGINNTKATNSTTNETKNSSKIKRRIFLEEELSTKSNKKHLQVKISKENGSNEQHIIKRFIGLF